MKFFVDTADVAEIRELAATGLLDGVTTSMYGADVATVPPTVLKGLVKYPLTDKGLDMFLADWKKTGQTIS